MGSIYDEVHTEALHDWLGSDEREEGLASLRDIRNTDGMEATATTYQPGATTMSTTTKTIKCGNCKGTHGSAAEVKTCHGLSGKLANAELPHSMPIGNVVTSDTPGVSSTDRNNHFHQRRAQLQQQAAGATEKQIKFLKTLCSERKPKDSGSDDTWLDIFESTEMGIDAMLAKLTKKAASDLIGEMLDCPRAEQVKREATAPATNEVPEGYYAVTSLSGANDLDFFAVQKPTEGKWAGYTFVKQVVGGKPEFRVARDRVALVLKAIEDAGHDEAAKLYGQEIGRCGKCNRTLTDETSREIGLGPVCRESL